jgi:hypothetical protein
MKTTDWSAVVTSAPQNKTAAVVRDGSGDQPGKSGKIDRSLADGSLSYRPIPYATYDQAVGNRSRRGASVFPDDYTGLVFDRLEIIGATETGVWRWIGVCLDCGCYSIRSKKAVRNAATGATRNSLRCHRCEHHDHIKWMQTPAGRAKGKPLNLALKAGGANG